MDVHHVTNQYTQLLLSQRQTLQKAKSRQGQRPRDRKSRDDAYTKFMLSLMFRRDETQELMIYSSFIPPAYPPCITPMDQLRRIAIKDLQLETHHRGTYLLLRSITPPSRMTAIMALMEDEGGDAILLQLYQQQDENTRKAVDVVDVGTILLIKEPFFKIMADGEYGVRVDHLSDVVRFGSDDAKIPQAWQPRLFEVEVSAESLKMEGNQAMGESRYWDAIME
jgi:hypothetical protein